MGLPACLQTVLAQTATRLGLSGQEGQAQEVAEAAVASGRHAPLLTASLAAIVRRSSMRQAAAGLLAAGPARAAAYVAAKLRKAWRRRPG